MQRRSFLAAGAALAGGLTLPWAAQAQQAAGIPFDAIWQGVSFSRLTPTRYGLGGNTLSIAADSSSSLIYRQVPDAARGARTARWAWAVEQSVPPTDLSRKGGDDRNISVYVVFMEPQEAAGLSSGISPQRLLSNRSARTLIYVWGGNHAPGALLASPYLRGRGFTIALRPAGTGAERITVDLAGDYMRAFGTAPGVLIGLAVSADSDDTNTSLRATLSDLVLG